METTLQFLERSLSTNGTISQLGTPQNLAFMALETSFPNLTPMNGNQREIAQIYALNTLYFSLNGTSWRMRTGWTGPTDPCADPTWFGVRCNAGTVVDLVLPSNDLMGTLPSEIQGLSSLGTHKCMFPSHGKANVSSLTLLDFIDAL
jgi:hypothetical protein